MKKRGIYILAACVVSISLGYLLMLPGNSGAGEETVYEVVPEKFTAEVSSLGQLEALNFSEVHGPSEARKFRLWNFTIDKLVDEGTLVEKGDFVAELDRSEFYDILEERRLELDQYRAQFEQVQFDTSLNLRMERDNIQNLEYIVQEQELILEQSQFEPPAVIKQNEHNLEKAKRELKQAKERFRIISMQEKVRIEELAIKVKEKKWQIEQMESLLDDFTVYAPEDGLVIYKTKRRKKIKEGDKISTKRPVVATLPDLNTMISVTQVNEVDIRTIELGQPVEVALDAFPDRIFNGKVTDIGNVGQNRSNGDFKVFEVIVQLNEVDTLLRPSMSTDNTIITNEMNDVLTLPLEAIHLQNDSINYVYLEEGVKQEVLLGVSGREKVIVEKGLNTGEKVLLSPPSWGDSDEVRLLGELDGKRNLDSNEGLAVVE